MCKKAMISKNYKELDEAIKQKLPPYLYNGGKGEHWIKYTFSFTNKDTRRVDPLRPDRVYS